MKEFAIPNQIHQYIAEGEHQQQDFKFEISDSCKIARTLSAFANTHGGRLLIGVKDNGKIAGVQSEEERYMMEAAAELYCQPPVPCELRSCTVENKTVLIAEIKEQAEKPVYAKNEEGKYLAYVRVKDENILATPVHLAIWKQADSAEGELLQYTEKEEQLLNLLKERDYLSINQIGKKAGLSRRSVVRLLAKFIRFGIIKQEYHDKQFLFKLV